MVARPFRSVSRTPGGAIAESGSSHDDSLLVRQQLLRSVDRRGSCALPHRRATALQQFPKRWHFLRHGGVHRPLFILVFGCGLCEMESLGPRRLLGTLPNTVCFASVSSFYINLDRKQIRLCSFCLSYLSCGRHSDLAHLERAPLFRSSHLWRFGVPPVDMGRFLQGPPNKVRS